MNPMMLRRCIQQLKNHTDYVTGLNRNQASKYIQLIQFKFTTRIAVMQASVSSSLTVFEYQLCKQHLNRKAFNG